MKNVLICLMLLCVGAISSAKEESFTLMTENSKVHESHKNSRSGEITSGSLRFDKEQMSMQVNFAKRPCPRGRVCAQVMPKPLVVSMEEANFEKGSCGSTYVYETSEEQVTLTDYRGMTCRMMVPGQIKVKYVTLDQDGEEEASTLWFQEIEQNVSDDEEQEEIEEQQVVTWFNCTQEKRMMDNSFSAKVYVNDGNFEEAVMVVSRVTIAGTQKQSYQMEVYTSRRVGATTVTLDNEVIALSVTQVVNPSVKSYPAILSLKEAGRDVKLVCSKQN